MAVENRAEDSVCATRMMREMGVGCIIVLGGDGTNRVVARECGPVPIVPVSTGTNNVIPHLIEGTVAGLAAGFVARHPELLSQMAYRSKRLEVIVDDRTEPDLALVDVAVVEGTAVASHAVWEPNTVRQVIVTRAEPTATGISSLVGFLAPVSPREARGLCLSLGEPRICQVTAPLAPGLVVTFGVKEVRDLSIGDSVQVRGGNRLLALDGEREIPLTRDQVARIVLRDDGPWFVDPFCAMEQAVAHGTFVRWAGNLDSCFRGGNGWAAQADT
jgi:predicted polyphosphate/ATP-dependent NAD kinase